MPCWMHVCFATTVKNAYGEDQGTGDLAFKLLQAEFVLYVNFTTCNEVSSNENHFTVSVNSL